MRTRRSSCHEEGPFHQGHLNDKNNLVQLDATCAIVPYTLKSPETSAKAELIVAESTSGANVSFRSLVSSLGIHCDWLSCLDSPHHAAKHHLKEDSAADASLGDSHSVTGVT